MQYNVYEPNKYLKMGIRIWPHMFRELWASRELICRLFIRDWSARYRQAALGYLWALIMPFVAIGTFAFLSSAGVLNIGSTDAPYPIFALIGVTVWQLFSSGLAAGCNSIVGAGGMVSKINFPREVLVFSSVSQAFFEFLIKTVLIAVLFLVYRYKPSWGIVLSPLTLIPMVALTLGLSLMLSLVNGIIRDTANMVALLTTFLMFLTPVLYPVSDQGNPLFALNPLTPLVNAPRDLIIYGHIRDQFSFFVASALSILIFFISWRAFHLVETKIPERL